MKSKSLKSGKFIFKDIVEGERIISFNPPLVVEYSIWEKFDKETGKENFSENVKLLGYSDYDFGMKVSIPLDLEHNFLMNGYEGINKNSELEDILMKSLMYDLFHSFFHISSEDINHNHYFWALKGWLKDRVILKDN